MSNGLNPPISDDRHPKTSGVLCNLVHRCTLGPPAGHHCTFPIGYKIRLVFDSVWCELTLNYYHKPLFLNLPSWVMQMEPQPMPTLRASTPASIRFLACAAVTTRERQRRRNSVRAWTWNRSFETAVVFTVSTNHLEFRVFLLDVVYRVDLVHRISLGGVLQTMLNVQVLLGD